MTIGPVTYISINLGPIVGANDFLAGVRVVPTGREGNRVYGRTLNPGEADSGEGIPLEVGETLEFPAGSICVTMADVDRYSKPDPSGYAPVANTVWTWLAIPPRNIRPNVRQLPAGGSSASGCGLCALLGSTSRSGQPPEGNERSSQSGQV